MPGSLDADNGHHGQKKATVCGHCMMQVAPQRYVNGYPQHGLGWHPI